MAPAALDGLLGELTGLGFLTCGKIRRVSAVVNPFRDLR